MNTSSREVEFASWNPHFTPRWLSEKLASHLRRELEGTVVDPACGAGNLLLAAALHLGASDQPESRVRWLGMDTSTKAVRACESSLAKILPRTHFEVRQEDFFALAGHDVPLGPATVLMNPPFKGYGKLDSHTRRQIAAVLEMRGRFNLGYAFVQRAVALYRPTQLIALLPSNWIYSRASRFRAELDALSGSWEWEDIGGDAFDGVQVDVGILNWRPMGAISTRSGRGPSTLLAKRAGLEVRQGVATGRDSVFFEIAAQSPRFGNVVSSVRGRDVGRDTSRSIWVPPSDSVDRTHAFEEQIAADLSARLRERSCVSSGRRRIYEFHESLPSWFLACPKLILPEIVCGDLRVELDSNGIRLPLHSALAIKVPSIKIGKQLRSYLAEPRVQARLLADAPRLSAGTVRLQVEAVREALARFIRRRRRLAQRSNTKGRVRSRASEATTRQ